MSVSRDQSVAMDEITVETEAACNSKVTIENVEFDVNEIIQGYERAEQTPVEIEETELRVETEPSHRKLDEDFECPEIHEKCRSQKEHESLVCGLQRMRERCKETKDTIEEEIKHLNLTKQLVLKDIRSFKKELLLRLDELEANSVEIVNERFRQITEQMWETTMKINGILKQIDETLRGSQTERMAKLDGIRETTAEVHDKEVQINEEIEGFEGLSVCLDKSIKTVFGRTDGLVKINRPCHAALTRKVDIVFESDKETSGISDISNLPDGTVVMTDLSNDCLKRLDASYKKESVLNLDGGPLGICATRYGELVVTLRESRVIQFVEYTPSEMIATKSFPAECSCNYICCLENVLYVTCEGGDEDNVPGHIRKFDKAGNLLGVIETDFEYRRMFTTPLHITSNIGKSKLFVTDMDSKVVILDKTGSKLGQYRDGHLESPFGISVLRNDNILVSSVDSHSVQQFDDKGRFVGTILSKASGLQNPVCIKYNAPSRQIMISMDDCNKLLVFNVSFPAC